MENDMYLEISALWYSVDWVLCVVSLIALQYYILSNFWVAQNRRFVINPVYPGGAKIGFAKILDFRLWKPTKCTLQDLLLSQIIPRKLNFTLSLWELSWISTWHNNMKFNNSLFNSQHFSWFKYYEVFIHKLVPSSSFTSAKTIRALFETDLLLMMKVVVKSNTCS